jgi:hypothetical protein
MSFVVLSVAFHESLVPFRTGHLVKRQIVPHSRHGPILVRAVADHRCLTLMAHREEAADRTQEREASYDYLISRHGIIGRAAENSTSVQFYFCVDSPVRRGGGNPLIHVEPACVAPPRISDREAGWSEQSRGS